MPFWPTYLTVAIGEAISMAIGGVLMAALLPRLTALAKAKS
ncbi:QueT transporter family protein [Lacticaseibacillus saniviri]|nr:QueT transporter family protein [Lacticaseibacillus saniviri]